MNPSFQHLSVRRNGPVATVTTERPAVANALNTEHLLELEQATLGFREDSETRAVIFAGVGPSLCGKITDTGANDQTQHQPSQQRPGPGNHAHGF